MGPLAIVALATKHSRLRWLVHLGGPGLILMGLADNSIIPLPGSMDILTIWLAAGLLEPWFYYAVMATAGAVLGGYLTYRMALKGGKETLEKKFSKAKADRVYAKFERWGFWAIAIPAVLPPPFPIVPSLLAAGAMQYPQKKFLAALTLGRGVRFALFAFLGAHYGRHIVRFFSEYYKPALAVVIALAAGASIVVLVKYVRLQKGNSGRAKARKPRARTA